MIMNITCNQSGTSHHTIFQAHTYCFLFNFLGTELLTEMMIQYIAYVRLHLSLKFIARVGCIVGVNNLIEHTNKYFSYFLESIFNVR